MKTLCAFFILATLIAVENASSSTAFELLRELKRLCLEVPESQVGSDAFAPGLLAKKNELAAQLRERPESVADAINSLELAVHSDPSPRNSMFVDNLIEILDETNPDRFLTAAFAAVASPTIKPQFKSQFLSRVYTSATVRRTNDLAYRERVTRIVQTAAANGDKPLRLSALLFLAGTSEEPFPRKGLDPALGYKILREIVEDDRTAFEEKEPFAFELAKRDPKFVDYYNQNVRVHYLETLVPRAAGFKLRFARRLQKLGRYSEEELTHLKAEADKERH